MKQRYKNLLLIFFAEVLSVSMMKEFKITSWIGNAIVAFIFLLPIQILFFLLSKDEDFSKTRQDFFKIIFWFINISYIMGGIGALF